MLSPIIHTDFKVILFFNADKTFRKLRVGDMLQIKQMLLDFKISLASMW